MENAKLTYDWIEFIPRGTFQPTLANVWENIANIKQNGKPAVVEVEMDATRKSQSETVLQF
jgi:hypothetical protein